MEEYILKYESTSINYDYYIGKYNKFTSYIGAGIGQGKLSWDINGVVGASGTGLEYGMRIGTLVEISKNTNIEFGYTTLIASAEGKLVNPNNSAESIKIEADDAKGLFIGFNYKF